MKSVLSKQEYVVGHFGDERLKKQGQFYTRKSSKQKAYA
jgi:uncharacterized protein YutD